MSAFSKGLSLSNGDDGILIESLNSSAGEVDVIVLTLSGVSFPSGLAAIEFCFVHDAQRSAEIISSAVLVPRCRAFNN